MDANQDLLDLLMELQSLDHLPRVGYSQRGIPQPESVSEHIFHVVFLVWALAPRVPGLDRRRAMELALIHDLAEVRFGDLPRTAAHYLPKGAKAEAERHAMADLLSPLGSEGPDLLREYQQGTSPEARFVSVCDKLQLILKARVYESWGHAGAGELADLLDRFDDGGFEAVAEVVRALGHRPAAPIGESGDDAPGR
ncbi:MAG: HD domain-containing protein [Acidobacteriota bacterium]